MILLWSHIQGERSMFEVSVPPDANVAGLKKAIYEKGSTRSFAGYDQKDLILTKVDVKIDDVWDAVSNGLYSPSRIEVLKDNAQVSGLWPEPASNELHVVVTLPNAETKSVDAWYKAATHLHKAMWKKSFGEKLVDVDGCDNMKYLPSTEIKDLRLDVLGCDADVILIRKDYAFTYEKLQEHRPNVGGIVLTGQPGIGKSVFLFYLLLCLLDIGQPVALQRGQFFYVFSENGVERHPSDINDWTYQFESKLWALTDSTSGSKTPCQSFQIFSRRKLAYIVQATSPAEERWKEWEKECRGQLFVMKCLTEKEAKALSAILGLDVDRFLANFKKWGPSARTCINLGLNSLSEERLQNKVIAAAKEFAQDPAAINMQALSQDVSHTLFAVAPNTNERLDFTLKVATPYLCGILIQEMGRLDATARASFYQKASTLPHFRGTWGYMFEMLFFAWLYSSKPGDDVLSCTAKSSAMPTQPLTASTSVQALTAPMSAQATTSAQAPTSAQASTCTQAPTSAGDQVKLRQRKRHLVQAVQPLKKKPRLEPPVDLSIEPLGQEKVFVNIGDSHFQNAKDSMTPCCWVPSSRTFPSLDAVICTKKEVITVQLTVASTHTMKPSGFERLKDKLPTKFGDDRTWCHVFITDSAENAAKLRKQGHDVAIEKQISIYTAVFDVFRRNLFSSDMSAMEVVVKQKEDQEDEDQTEE